MWKKQGFLASLVLAIILCATAGGVHAEEGQFGEEKEVWGWGPDLVRREDRRTVVSTEYGEISAVRVTDIINGTYLLHFFTLDPNALFLPVILHADMVFYVHTGSGRLSWTEEDDLKSADLRRGDVYRLEQGTTFFIQSNLETETERQKLRIHAIFTHSRHDLREPSTGPYSSIRDMVLGFDKNVLQAAFKVSEEVIDELFSGTKPPAIIHAVSRTSTTAWEMDAQFIGGLLGSRNSYYNIFELNKKKKESSKLFNLFKEDKDFENCNGWSTTVTRKKLSALKGSDMSLFMVNLTTGSMMGPHWNPRATEIAIVLQGRGMVRVVCPRISNQTALCRNTSFLVEEGDVFAVPRFHPMAQMSFNNGTFVFMGFSTSAKRNHPQFLAGKASVLRVLDKDVLGMSFNVTNTTLDRVLEQQHDLVILGCVSCAEQEFRVMEEEMERERAEAMRRKEEETRREEEERRREEEEAAKREEEERRKRQEEEAERKRQEEEAERKRQEEEARHKEEEEAARRQEEERQRQEEEAARRQQEERERQEAEAEAERRRQEEEARHKEEEEAARRQEEERKRQEAEAERRRQEEEARQKEEEEAARRQEDERQRQEAEAEAARRRQEEETRQREEEEAAAARREEEERQRQEAETRRRQEEETRQREEERQRQEQEEAQRTEEERQRQREEEEARQREQEQEEPRRRRPEEGGGRSEAEEAAEAERRMEEEAEREAEAARQQQREREGGEGARAYNGEDRIINEQRRRNILQKRLTI